MVRSSLCRLIFCLALSAVMLPVAAKAEPRVLTTSQLATVTAGQITLQPIQINLNTTVQVARATAISIAICAACTNATVTAFSRAAAFNFNVAELTNAAF